ncbi:YqcI/YcgG family protein [Bacillus taeanensis]|uniref:YqcI/YcgG family protein n=1 Tax=Bacillus taeanensis TaxID=273032 RepID=A0A366XZ16_9BACI|nr:YqcI/YcgG family protein [Bacillus taeanensis]RBW71167.1 YqcI/YcgG family protein [Bacillus taeanensis]
MINKEKVPHWVAEEFQTFHNIVTDPTFPCYFGIHAQKKGELRYTYLSHNDWSHFPDTVRDFLYLMHEDRSVRRGLFVFVEPEREERSIEYYRAYFWRLLDYLHERDKKEWPAHIPKNPDHHLWAFSFDGEPFFTFGNAPAYKQRKTRDLGNCLVIGMQPRMIFEGLEGDRPTGIKSRQSVRERVEAWDNLPKHPNISHYGDENHREWKQYFIGDDVKPITGKCPFHHKSSS